MGRMGRLNIVAITGAGTPILVASIVISLVCYCMCKLCKHSLEDREPPQPDPGLIAILIESERIRARNASQGEQDTARQDPPQNQPPSSSRGMGSPPPFPTDESWIVPPPMPPPPYDPQSSTPPLADATKTGKIGITQSDRYQEPIPLPWSDQGRLTSSGSANCQNQGPMPQKWTV